MSCPECEAIAPLRLVFQESALHTDAVNVGFLLANVVGAVLYLVGTSHGWVDQAERGMIPVTGEPFVWATAAIPILALFTVVNLIWGILLLRRGRSGGPVWLAAAGLWLVVIVIDSAHHGYPAWT